LRADDNSISSDSESDDGDEKLQGMSEHLRRNNNQQEVDAAAESEDPFAESDGILGLSDDSNDSQERPAAGVTSARSTPRHPLTGRRQDSAAAVEQDARDDGEDERIAEGIGRENIWDRIQHSSGKKRPSDAHSSPPSPVPFVSSGQRPAGLGSSGDDEDDAAAPQTSSADNSPVKEGVLSPSAVLANALSSITAIAVSEDGGISPPPLLSGMLRRRSSDPLLASRSSNYLFHYCCVT